MPRKHYWKKSRKTIDNKVVSSTLRYIEDNSSCSIQGSYHQGHQRFGENGGSQCVANSLVSILLHFMSDVSSWTTLTLNHILENGNKLYSSIRRQSTSREELLLISELPNNVNILKKSFQVFYANPLCGNLGGNVEDSFHVEGFIMPLNEALNATLTHYNACFVTFALSTFSVLKKNEAYYIFDPHSRNKNGQQIPDGTSVLLKFDMIDNIVNHCLRLMESFHIQETQQFEVTGVQTCYGVSSVQYAVVSNCTSQIAPSNNDVSLEEDLDKSTDISISKRNSKSLRTERMKDRKILYNTKKRLQYLSDPLYRTGLKYKRKSLYHDDELHREQKKSDGIFNYQSDLTYRINTKRRSSLKYQKNIKHREKVKNISKEKYATDYEHREEVKRMSKEKYAIDDEHREEVKRKSKKKYAVDDEHRAEVKSRSKEKYAVDDEHRAKVKSRSKEKYAVNDEHRAEVKSRSKEKYAFDDEHRENVKSRGKEKYAVDDDHREKVKSKSKEKYAEHRAEVKSRSKEKYAVDDEHRENVKRMSLKKYAENMEHKEKVKKKGVIKYRCDKMHREKLKKKNLQKYYEAVHANQLRMRKIENSIAAFREKISNGPEFVCCVCLRLLFAPQVISCSFERFDKKGGSVSKMAKKCIIEENCETGDLWICYNCNRKLLLGKMPAEAAENNMKVGSIPGELEELNSLEQHLISIHIPFAKMISLPKGGQLGVHGPVVCVPANFCDIATKILPRKRDEDLIIRVKLKRKLKYKGHYLYEYVNRQKLKSALEYLKLNNEWYEQVAFNDDWDDRADEHLNDIPEEPELEINDEELQQEHDYLMRDTCLQPVDIAQDILDQHENILCIAPAETNIPVKILMPGNEAKCFPTLYPNGHPTFTDYRDVKITLSRYLHCRLMNSDTRFSCNTNYIFYAQYISELNQVISSVSIALRKGKGSSINKITAKTLTDKEPIESILRTDRGYKFLKPIRGTPAYWQSAQKDLFAMMRQIGIPTFFCSFSSADMRWPEFLKTVMRQCGDERNVEELTWMEKCKLLRQNPVTAARMFENRFHHFLKDLILTAAEPIGKVIDYFYRVEFQQRGSPHTHCLFWVENAPQANKDSDELVTEFIDKYITCEMPDEDEDAELWEIVGNVQRHSIRHTKSCQKGGRNKCRFNFPRPPSQETFLANVDGKTDKMRESHAKSILQKLHIALTDSSREYTSVFHLFSDIGTSQKEFKTAYCTLTKQSNVVLKRRPQDIWINQYNRHLLRAWNANMDIQYILDAFACIVYIVSYISKSEREMGLLLKRAQEEALHDENENAKTAMKRLGSVYLQSREVSCQEAVFRVCNLKLKECSRKVQFVPVGDNVIKISLPIAVIKQMEGSCTRVWMTSLYDRYKSRPNEGDFINMCYATFCSEYRVVSKSEATDKNGFIKSDAYVLEDDNGHVKKRTRTQPAIIRYPKFSSSKTPEKYYQSILQLFLPHRSEIQLKPLRYQLFQTFFNHGAVKMGNEKKNVIDIVISNRATFEINSEMLEEAEEIIRNQGVFEDAWAMIGPEEEGERLECEGSRAGDNDEEEEDTIADLERSNKVGREASTLKVFFSKSDADAMLRSLNEEQSAIFYKIRDWCLRTLHGKHPNPFHVFITGGAGTGKSHLIKAIHYESTRLLARLQDNPDAQTVMITAPTGVAAFNINGRTIHNAFSIQPNIKLPYIPLGEDRINTLRAELGSVMIVIIDEISMVHHKLLYYIHGRLNQIKSAGHNHIFGRVSIIAVGDFYQLPPIKGTPLYAYSLPDLWNDNFNIAELTEIMRQKDDIEFAEVLNRLRKKAKKEPMSSRDVDLITANKDEDLNATYIFSTNAEVDRHNEFCLQKIKSNRVTIVAKDMITKRSRVKSGKSRVFTLPRVITIAEQARVMLIKNIDVCDGLVNGATGTIVRISQTSNEETPIVYIIFDNKYVGARLRSVSTKDTTLPEYSTPISIQEEKAYDGNLRKQLPLRLSWACTIHKVQGLTLEKAVISLKKIFAPGQAYVALSRVNSVTKLTVKDFDADAIFSNEKINAVDTMQQFIPFTNEINSVNAVRILLFNIQGLEQHHENLKFDRRIRENDIICLTETWLKHNSDAVGLQLPNFSFRSRERSSCYDTSTERFKNLKEQNCGGIAIYRNVLKVEECINVQLTTPNLEQMTIILPYLSLIIIVVYRPPSYPGSLFISSLQKALAEIDGLCSSYMVIGDFNQNILSDESSIKQFMISEGYEQYVAEPTTEGGTLIDHVYFKTNGEMKVTAEVFPEYYSYHEAVMINIHQ